MFNKNQDDQPVALGFTAKELVELLNTKEAAAANKSLKYFDGQQEEPLMAVLNVQRARWKEKHINPRFRNITKMIVEKSGMIFKDAPPTLAIFDADLVVQNKAATEMLYELFSREEFAEYWNSFDQVLRLLKTAIAMIQWDAVEKKFVPDILHRGNCEVILSPINRKVIGLIYRVADNMYQVWTDEEVIELTESSTPGAYKQVFVTGRESNPFKTIPAVPFYDTNTPRTGFWVEQDKSLVNLNEMVNLHLTDSEYSLLWCKMSTLFTNMKPSGEGTVNYETTPSADNVLGRVTPSQDPSYMAGPGNAVVLDSIGVDSPFVRYENPKIDLAPLNEVVNDWIRNQAADWSVRIEVAGQGKAQSGFQFVVEEMPNLELRRQRQRMFESGFKRMYRVIRTVFNTATGVRAFPEDSQLYAIFEPPRLPVDIQQQETVWTQKINEGRATELDYFQQVEGISKEEAEKRFAEIVAFRIQKASMLEPLAPEPVAEPAAQTNDKTTDMKSEV